MAEVEVGIAVHEESRAPATAPVRTVCGLLWV